MDPRDRNIVSLTERRRAAERAARPPRPSPLARAPRAVGMVFAGIFWLVLAAGLAGTAWSLLGR